MLRRLIVSVLVVAASQGASQAVGQEGDAAAPAEEQVVTRAIGDWSLVCAAAGAPCVMQQVGKTESGADALRIEIAKLPADARANGQRVEALASILTPHNVLLQPGVRIQVDQGQTASVPFFLCQQSTCMARTPMDAAAVNAFKRGAMARATFVLFNEEGQTADLTARISLSGFTRAFDQLK